MALAGLFAFAMLSEWWPIAIKQDLARIGSYHFGSVSMMGQGGWRYANPEVYAWTALAEAVAAIATMPAIWLTIVRRSRKGALALVVVCAVYLASSVVLGQIHWSARQAGLSSVVWFWSRGLSDAQVSGQFAHQLVETGDGGLHGRGRGHVDACELQRLQRVP
jgi:hypothetical protein